MKYDIYHHEFDGNDAQARNLTDAIAAILKGDARVSVSFGFQQQNPVIVLANPYSENAQDICDISVDGIVVEFSHVEVYDDQNTGHGDPDVEHPENAIPVPAANETEQPSEPEQQQPAPEGEW